MQVSMKQQADNKVTWLRLIWGWLDFLLCAEKGVFLSLGDQLLSQQKTSSVV